MALDIARIYQQLSRLEGWELEENTIRKAFAFPDFPAALAFVNRIGELAERANHHPDILVQYSKVTLTLTTHDSGGLTGKDFSLAEQINQLR
ncbi:4a-hydroxytetrahydrobiopterin dehydratase [Candidatus Woesearchaeota archaeon]|nr:4a-hydroxytetrahydrobiopterin dehydratase [Candidatus Woesearchaeota archaeon]